MSESSHARHFQVYAQLGWKSVVQTSCCMPSVLQPLHFPVSQVSSGIDKANVGEVLMIDPRRNMLKVKGVNKRKAPWT